MTIAMPHDPAPVRVPLCPSLAHSATQRGRFAASDSDFRWVPNAIDGTGNRDVTGQINSFLAGVAPGTTVMFVEIRGNVQRVADGPAMTLDRVCNLTVAGNQFLGASPERTVLAACGAPPPVTTTAPKRKHRTSAGA